MPKIFNENGIVYKMDLSIKRSCQSNVRVDQTVVSIKRAPAQAHVNTLNASNYFLH
jgi:hypothetical protein